VIAAANSRAAAASAIARSVKLEMKGRCYSQRSVNLQE
jgi:hypothetical protein